MQRFDAVIAGMVLHGVAVCAAASTNAHAQAAQDAAAPLIFRGVTVIDVRDGRHLRGYSVVVRGTRVRAMGPTASVRVPPGARVIDAPGKYLIPGLWDMHAHPMSSADVFYPMFVANGITGIRDAGSEVALTTLSRWKQEIAAGTRVGPRLVVAGPSIVGCPVFDSHTRHQVCVSTAAEVRQLVDFLKFAGADVIKLYSLNRELYLAAMSEARRLGLPFGGHFYPTGVDGGEASDSGAWLLDHQTWLKPNVCGETNEIPPAFEQKKCAAASARLRRNGTWVVMTPLGFGLPFFPQLFYEHVLPYVPDASTAQRYAKEARVRVAARDSAAPAAPRRPRSLADWKAVLASPANPLGPNPWLRDSTGAPPVLWNYAETPGLPIVVGTDASTVFGNYAGFGVHDALVSFVLGGMSPLEALQTATLNPALALRSADSLGTVEAGKLADLVLLDADPLEDIWNTTKIRAVVANGRYFDRRTLDGLLSQARRAARR